MRSLACALLALCACSGLDSQIRKLDDSYAADTILANKLLEPMALEPSHGQLTVTLTTRFAEKLLRASLQPNLLQLSIASGGRAWKQEVSKLGITFDNGVWLDGGNLQLALGADSLVLEGERLVMKARVDGKGQLAARMKLFGVPVARSVEVWSHYEDALRLQLEKGEHGWLLRAVGDPLKVHVEVTLPAISLAGKDFLQTTFARDVAFPVERLKAFPLPVPAPREVKVGANTMQLALKDLALGAHDDRLYFGANLAAEVAEPAPAEARASAPAK